MTIVAATARTQIADFLGTLVWVYTILIFAYIVLNFLFAMGVRPPYNRVFDAVLTFLRDVSEPYLSIFRRFIPPIGPLDISPIVAIFVLQIVAYRVIIPLIRG